MRPPLKPLLTTISGLPGVEDSKVRKKRKGDEEQRNAKSIILEAELRRPAGKRKGLL
jgi:hypothetical protein